MDPRRLNTADLLASGILNKPAPKTPIPGAKEQQNFDLWDRPIDRSKVAKALEEGKVANCSEYYGIPQAWKAADGQYRGILLQYKSITVNENFASAEDAAKWFVETANAVAG